MEKILLETLRVLVVDDDPLFLDAVSHYFGRIFKEVYSASSSVEAIQLLTLHRPNIVITDIDMPKMDGHELAKEIHRISPNTPFFFLNALEESEKSRKLGDGFIQKPFFGRKDIESALSEIEEEMRRVIGHCSECIFLVDLDEYKYVQCELSGDLMPKNKMVHRLLITKPCPCKNLVKENEKEKALS